jgi:hypothetical protein
MVMPGLALVFSLVLLFQHRARLFPVIALVTSGLELLMATGIVHVNTGSVPLALLFGATLAIAGIAVYVKTTAKHVVSAATILALIGLLQVASALHLHVL